MTKLKTVSIKGKPYVTVNERILEFHRLHPSGEIKTEIVQQDENTVTIKATVSIRVNAMNDPYIKSFTGHAHEDKRDISSFVNKYSHIENCETSAVGRALAMLGIGIIDSIASAEEVLNAQIKRGELKAGDVVRTDTTETEIPHCSIDNKAMLKGRYGWYCPDYKKHKADKVKSSPIFDSVEKDGKEGTDESYPGF